MKNKSFVLEKPYTFRIRRKIINDKIKSNEVLVRILLGSICQADIRYYTGQRRKKDLLKKLPAVLIHEAIGKIIKGYPKKTIGTKVILVPNIACKTLGNTRCCSREENIKENYRTDSIFLSSGYDGFCQKYITIPQKNIVPIPNSIPDDVAVMAELISVVQNFYKRIPIKKKSRIAILGDGPLGYIVANFFFEKNPNSEIVVFGINDQKLSNFNFIKTINSKRIRVGKFQNYFDLVIECIGGEKSSAGINQAIQIAKPEGLIVLMGVSEKPVAINTRDVLAKGLTLMGTSRSETEDYSLIIPLLKKKRFQERLKKMIAKMFICDSIKNLKKAFNFAAKRNRRWGKILLKIK